jgi:type IV secretion system protein VirB9
MRRLIPLCLATLLMTSAVASAQTTREVTYNSHAVVRINTKIRFTTMIILPDAEEILDVVCGDKDFWVISGAHNLAYVKPAKAGDSTNLNLVTASGTIYSFWITEGASDPDFKLYITPDDSLKAPAGGHPRFFSAADMDDLRHQLDAAKKDAEAARDLAAKSAQDSESARQASERAADERVNAFKASYPTQLAFPYWFKANAAPFFVSAIYHDDKFTYIHANARELPSLYELRDRAPNLINFQVENGVYIVPKILESGYLVIGKQKLEFGTLR